MRVWERLGVSKRVEESLREIGKEFERFLESFGLFGGVWEHSGAQMGLGEF